MKSNHEQPSMPDKPNQQGRQMTLRESEGCIVPLKLQCQWGESKPGNAGAGKASKPVRPRVEVSSEHSVGLGRCGHVGNGQLALLAGTGGEPDGVTPHVRI
jgi:hypothetical protein